MQKQSDTRAPRRYITQIVAFHRWPKSHYLPPNAQLMWYRMIALFNECGWPATVQIDSWRLAAMIGSQTEKTALLARDKLVEAGFLHYEKGGKGCPNRYEMLWFPDPREETDSTLDSK